MTDGQIDIVAEITGESYSAVATAAAEINAATEAAIVADVVTWNENRNAVDFEMSGGSDGIKLKARNILDAITERTRLRLGFPSLKTTFPRGSTSVITCATF